ncbi:hypothetical protein B0H10DRAFT_742165 [Mycena sp. CBHHK59/15]|nr:hypothetical protein B0H10DRAFT_742165 [Mycena sp. CBHHK59/15]
MPGQLRWGPTSRRRHGKPTYTHKLWRVYGAIDSDTHQRTPGGNPETAKQIATLYQEVLILRLSGLDCWRSMLDSLFVDTIAGPACYSAAAFSRSNSTPTTVPVGLTAESVPSTRVSSVLLSHRSENLYHLLLVPQPLASLCQRFACYAFPISYKAPRVRSPAGRPTNLKQYAHLSASDPEFQPLFSTLPAALRTVPLDLSIPRAQFDGALRAQIVEHHRPQLPPENAYAVKDHQVAVEGGR